MEKSGEPTGEMYGMWLHAGCAAFNRGASGAQRSSSRAFSSLPLQGSRANILLRRRTVPSKTSSLLTLSLTFSARTPVAAVAFSQRKTSSSRSAIGSLVHPSPLLSLPLPPPHNNLPTIPPKRTHSTSRHPLPRRTRGSALRGRIGARRCRSWWID